MPTEQERPEMFARPPKSPSTLKRGPAYGGGTILRKAPKALSVADASDTIEQHQERSHRQYAVPKSQLMRRKDMPATFDQSPMHAPFPLGPVNIPYYQAQQLTPGVYRIKRQHAEPLRSHPITHKYTEPRPPYHQDNNDASRQGSDGLDSFSAIESQVSIIQRADSPIEARSAETRTSSVEPADWKMVNKGPVVLSPTPPPFVRGDELFLDAKSIPSSSLVQATWSHVQTHSPEVSEVASLAQPLSADMIGRDKDASKKEKAYAEAPQLPDFQLLALNLPDGPSLHEEVFGRPADKEVNTRGNGGMVADNLEEYTKYTGWIERE